ncbi:LacI family DNA-binding transcriptional regulator [Streptomyces niveiscabiei]|uniref:LacI family DNA-binding transcriptional regulator n=1 Tax=Streptomyces niveiscabiei TaxID=164115 RepID=UPI0029AAC03D|nr:LacI family DNA-binding transcriptional regulator [Streptomyces niveiscabiei]MDX3381407.1 LacI family DNA-binding transcriptional regulator [Streptomyces niveiscabiei]
MATMADVARHAGVSVATVSHVLNGTRPVLPHTRRAVLDAVEALGYTPNTLARSLVTSRTRSIGLAVSTLTNPYFTQILQGVETAALEHGYSLLIADPHDDPAHERTVVQLLHERRVDGLVVAPSAEPSGLVSYLTRHRVPTVLLDRVLDTPPGAGPLFDQVCADNTEPTAGLVTHLASLGHRRIALIAGHPGLSTTAERVTGYRQALTAAGLPFDPHLVAHTPAPRSTPAFPAPAAHLPHTDSAIPHAGSALPDALPHAGSCAPEDLSPADSSAPNTLPPAAPLTAAPSALGPLKHPASPSPEQATAALLALPDPPTALVTGNDAITLGALTALRARGLTVPGDLALCCFDDFPWADLLSPRLTAVAQPGREIGARAVRLLLDRLAEPARPTRTVRLPSVFVHRTSCGCPEQPLGSERSTHRQRGTDS